MKKVFACTLLIFGVLLGNIQSTAQSLPITSYGAWDRGGKIKNFKDPNVDFVMGIEASEKWENIELVKGTFDFSSFQTELDKAYTNNKLIRFSVDVGPDAPLWMYDNDKDTTNNPYPQVQKVTTNGGNDKTGWPFYPEYLSQTYQDYLWLFLKQFSNFLRNQPQRKFKLIAFVQVKTGCTGDEIPYKGKVDSVKYQIPDKDWYAFRLKVFQKYKEYFNDVPNNPIVLTFNDIDPSDPNEVYAWNWATTNIDSTIGFGIKGGAFNRGHHLTGEQGYKESLYKYLVNPKGLKLFSASEMDQTWKNGYFAINPDLGFYWAALAGINVGLSTYNLSADAMTYVTTITSPRETFRMFTRYAQQVYPATATTAFCVFHEGLNSADTKKFSNNVYGKGNMTTVARYLAICNNPKYKNRGAQMDDTSSVIQGQVYQRANQIGFNDAGWDIAEGNIERFFTQINPDSTSIGLFRVRGKLDSLSSKYDRFARSFENATGKNTMYFKFDSAVFTNCIPDTLGFKIIWLDKKAGSKWSFRYKSSSGIKDAVQVTGVGDNTWKTVTFSITDAIANGSGLLGSDFTLANTDTINDIFNGIEVTISRKSIPLDVKFSEQLKAYQFNNGINVDWATASEINCDHFEIERSNNAIDFEIIATVKGQGLSSTSHSYSIYDAQPILGTNYYRIKEIDKDGKYTYSRVVSADYDKFEFKMSPNPVSNQIRIESSKLIEKIEILNAAGQIVKTFLGTKLTLDVQSLSKGVFFLKTYSKDNQFKIQKFSKI